MVLNPLWILPVRVLSPYGFHPLGFYSLELTRQGFMRPSDFTRQGFIALWISPIRVLSPYGFHPSGFYRPMDLISPVRVLFTGVNPSGFYAPFGFHPSSRVLSEFSRRGIPLEAGRWQKKIDRQRGDRLKRCNEDFQFISESLRWYDPDQVPRV